MKQNIARMAQDIDDQAVIAAAKKAGVHEMILHLPHGYETPANKYSLSGDQKQRKRGLWCAPRT